MIDNPLDDFLERPFSCEGNDALQMGLRKRTTAMLSRKRRGRYPAVAGLAAACYLAGVATMWLSNQRTALTPQTLAPMIVEIQKNPAPAEPPEILEMQALAKPGDRAAELRKAGDLYLTKNQDYASAVRCYSEAFRTGDAEALAPGPDDNWLVIAIKLARQKETRGIGTEDNWVALKEYTKRKEKFNER